jgi:transcriptional regulator with XRE-family HTH domain
LQCSSGARLRGIRILGRRTLEDVVAAAGSGESFVSQVERGRTGTRLATPQDLAGVFGIGVSDLFVGDACRVWRPALRCRPGGRPRTASRTPCNEIVAVRFVLSRPGG